MAVKDAPRAELELEAAENIRGSLPGIMLGGWILAIRRANGVFSDLENNSEIRARAALIMLVAAEDWAYRSNKPRRDEIEVKITDKLYGWFDNHQQALPEELLAEVEMEKIKHDLRYAPEEEQKSVIENIRTMGDTSQKAVLMARAARITGDEGLMEEAVRLQQQFDNPERLAVLKRWQAEIHSSRKLDEYRQKALQIIYGEVIGRIPWSLLVPEQIMDS